MASIIANHERLRKSFYFIPELCTLRSSCKFQVILPNKKKKKEKRWNYRKIIIKRRNEEAVICLKYRKTCYVMHSHEAYKRSRTKYTVNPLLGPPLFRGVKLTSPPFQRRKVNKAPLSIKSPLPYPHPYSSQKNQQLMWTDQLWFIQAGS